MGKRCIVCGEEAVYRIKDTSDFYCRECAQENFADLDMLLKVEEEVTRLKDVLKERLKEGLEKAQHEEEASHEQND